MAIYKYFLKFPAPIKIPRLLGKIPKSQVDSRNPKIWGKIPSSGGLSGLGHQRLSNWLCKYVMPPGELNYDIYFILLKFSTFFALSFNAQYNPFTNNM